MRHDGNPMQSTHAAPRCTATSKRTGNPCRAPAVRGWRVCRMHGAGGGAKMGAANPNWKHGGRSGGDSAMRRMANDLHRAALATMNGFEKAWRFKQRRLGG